MNEVAAVIKARPEPGAEYSTTRLAELGPRDVVVRVKATAVCGTDIHIFDWTPYAQARVKPPTVLGHEFCGEVVEIGAGVTRVGVGDLIAGETHIPCGHCLLCETGRPHICRAMKILGVHIPGVFADYAIVPEAIAWKLPPNMPPAVGAVLEPAGVAVHAVYAADTRGANVLITGCGPIGVVAVKMARALGAKLVVASDVSERRREYAKQWGADVALDPRTDDVVRTCLSLTRGSGVDVSIEASGAPSAVRQALAGVRRAGQVVLFGLPGSLVELDLVEDVIYKEVTIKGITGREMWRTWYQLRDLVESNVLDLRRLVTHEFTLSNFREGIAAAKSGEAQKVVLYPGA